MGVKVIKTGIVEMRGETEELDEHGHPTGQKIQQSAVVSREVVLVDELRTMLENRRKVCVAQGFHERAEEIDMIQREIQ